jgi:hypothetical protein
VDGRLDAVTDDGELVGRGEGFWINDHHFSRREMEKIKQNYGELVGRGEGFWINDHHFSPCEMEKRKQNYYL